MSAAAARAGATRTIARSASIQANSGVGGRESIINLLGHGNGSCAPAGEKGHSNARGPSHDFVPQSLSERFFGSPRGREESRNRRANNRFSAVCNPGAKLIIQG